MPGPERWLTLVRWACEAMMRTTSESKGKLDATATTATARAAGRVGAANGPESDVLDWRRVDWRRVEDDVARLRQRIFTAIRAGDLAAARNLQKLMLRSRANALVSVRRVTELNAGRRTAGIDGRTVVRAHDLANDGVAGVDPQCWRALSPPEATNCSVVSPQRPGQGHVGLPGAAPPVGVECPARAAGVHPQGRWEAQGTRDSRDR